MDRASGAIESLIDEYRSYVNRAKRRRTKSVRIHWTTLNRLLQEKGDWTPVGRQHLVALARNYGTFILRNALALAVACDIEDGELNL